MALNEDDILNEILEATQKEVSYDEQLEQHKQLLLRRREVEDWKRISYEIGRCRQQYLRESCIARKQTRKLHHMVERLNEPRFETIVDQYLERWLADDGKPIDYAPEIERVRAKLNRMKQRISIYEESNQQIQKSKSHQMAKEITRRVQEEELKIEEVQKEISDLWVSKHVQANKFWENEKKVYVDLCQQYIECYHIEKDDEATLQNNEIKNAKIGQLLEEIRLAKVEQEEEAKRREIELSERLLIPVKIKHMKLGESVFKDPNDFPSLISKIESTRKTYEEIFKRPEYMNLPKKNKKKVIKPSSQFKLLFGDPKRKEKSLKVATQPTVTKLKQSTAKAGSAKLVTPREEPKPPMKENAPVSKPMNVDQLFTPVECSTPKCQPKPPKKVTQQEPIPQTVKDVSQDVPRITRKRKSLEASEPKAVEEQPKPVCNVQGQRVKQSPAPKSKPPCVALEDKLEKLKPIEPPARKRPSLEAPISSTAPPRVEDMRESKESHEVQQFSSQPNRKTKPKKVAFREPEEQQFEFNTDSPNLSPEKSHHKSKTVREERPPSPPSPPAQIQESQSSPEPMDCEPEPQQQQQQSSEGDSFSLGSVSPPPEDSHRSKGDGEFLDTVSLSGSISSIDMEDRGSGSDLGFDLSPVGPPANDRNTGSGASGDGDSDFDFLASPPNSGGPPAKKGQGTFDFMDNSDSGTGFDFF